MSQALNDRKSVSYTYNSLGNLHLQVDDLDEARRCYLEALRLAVEISQPSLVADVTCGLAEVDLDRGRVEPALEVLACVQVQEGVDQQTRRRAADLIETAAARLPAEVSGQAVAHGQARPLDEMAASLLQSG